LRLRIRAATAAGFATGGFDMADSCLVLAPGVVGLIRWLKARLQNRRGAPVWQPVGGRMWSNSSGAARVLARPGLTRRSHVEG